MGKIIKINKELDINRSEEYKEMLENLNYNTINFKKLISMSMTAGANFQRNYSIRNYKKCNEDEKEYIKEMSNIYKNQQKKFMTMINELMIENIAMKKVIKDNHINNVK